jgi:hypothetical protein
MTILRQGDVLVKKSRKKPSAAAKTVLDNGRTILAYGEVTGHAHEVITDAPDTDTVPAQQLFEEPDGTRLLVVRGPATLRHEEHAPLAIPAGTYEVIRQVEYTPTAIRNVAD